jgi:phospholipid/cholesterol/gamma-HCH transport system substrate-binding protein
MTQMKVGVFLLAGLIVLLGSIFTLGSNKTLFQDTFEVRSYFDSVQGLNVGGVVSLSGLKVGNVDRITFDETKNLVEVVSRIDPEFKAKIKKDSHIEIRTQGALGDKYLYITPGTTTVEAVKNGDEIQADYGNDFLAILSKRGSESEKLFDAISDFQKLMNSLTANNKIPSLLNKLDNAAGNLSEVSSNLNGTLKKGSFDRSITKLEKIVDKIDRGEGTLGALINDRSVHDRIKNILGAGQKNQQVKQILKSSVEE